MAKTSKMEDVFRTQDNLLPGLLHVGQHHHSSPGSTAGGEELLQLEGGAHGGGVRGQQEAGQEASGLICGKVKLLNNLKGHH